MVSTERTSFGHRDFQCRNECGRDHHARSRALDYHSLWMAMGIRCHGSSGISVVFALDGGVPEAGRAPTMLTRRTRVHSKRWRKGNGPSAMGTSVRIPADVGIPARQVSDRPDLVVLSILGAGVFPEAARTEFGADWIASCGDLPDFRCWERGGRMAVVAIH